MSGPTSPVAVVEVYLDGLRRHDLSAVALAPDVRFQGPTTAGELLGAQAVRDYLASMFPATLGIRVHRHVAEGDYVVTLFDFETPRGVIPVLDLFHVSGGLIRSIRPFFDPTLLRATS